MLFFLYWLKAMFAELSGFLPQTDFMNLGKLLHFFVPQFPHLLYKTEGLFGELKKENAYEELSKAHDT